MSQQIKHIAVKDLSLWTENPRDPINEQASDLEIIKRAIKDDRKKWDLPSLLKEMGDHYDLSELPTVVVRNGKNVVFDGNRRVAVLKYLQNKNVYNEVSNGRLYLTGTEPQEMIDLIKIPCNVCDEETALVNIERKHIKNGSWNQLEIDYFLFNHRNQKKSLFILFDEATSLIRSNPKMNQEIVKKNILTRTKLNDIGFEFDENGNMRSMYDDETAMKILNKLVELRNNGTIDSRDGDYGKYQVKEPLLDIEEFKDKIQKFNDASSSKMNLENTANTQDAPKVYRRGRQTAVEEVFFGRKLNLDNIKIQNLYAAIDDIYNQFNNKKYFESKLPILGMSLRLILDISSREHFGIDEDSAYKILLKCAKKDMAINKEDKNFLALTNSWLDEKENMDGILSKYAHGNISPDKGNLINQSIIVGDILEFYFGKDRK